MAVGSESGLESRGREPGRMEEEEGERCSGGSRLGFFPPERANLRHQEIGGFLVMPFKPLKIVIRSRKGYNGPALTVEGYEPTQISK